MTLKSNKARRPGELTRKSTTGQALYRKYRSKSFAEVVGQPAIVSTLQKALKSGRISHAYLFSGPRGVGKTSVARILAHAVNKLAYEETTPHLDIIEIDAASNRRIDEIRDLREKVHTAPLSAKYKVYIIDEAHMLTKEAFNALLKTLEEPPSHCIFILATTEAHKLPATITSRTQHFSFKPIAQADLAKQLAAVAKKERLSISPGALELLAESAEGSLRDGLSLLDQLGAYGQPVDETVVLKTLGLPKAQSIAALQTALVAADHTAVLASLQDLQTQGVNPVATARQLAKRLRQSLIDAPQADSWLIELLQALVEVPASFEPTEALELALLSSVARRSAPERPTPSATESGRPAEPIDEVIEPPPPLKHPASDTDFVTSAWPAILEVVKTKAASLYTALRLASPRLEGDNLSLAFEFSLHANKLNQPAAQQLLEQLIHQQTGRVVKIRATVDKDRAVPQKPPAPAPPDRSLATISSIFGEAEVLESPSE